MLLNIILQKLVRNDNVFTDQLTELFNIISSKLAKMSDHFQAKISCRDTSLALTDFTAIISKKILMKGTGRKQLG